MISAKEFPRRERVADLNAIGMTKADLHARR